MSQKTNETICPCMMKGIEEYQMLVFPDGIKMRVKGLGRIFEIAYQEGKIPDRLVAGEMADQLSKENYIPSDERARLEYRDVILREYRKFCEAKKENKVGS
jgi:hypothetical protein